MEQLGKDPNELQYLGKSPIHKKVVELRLAKPSPSKISSGSEIDNGSVCSDTSFGSEVWSYQRHPNVYVRRKRSFTSMDSTEDNGKQGLTKCNSVKTCKSEIEEDVEDEDDDVFGGVYCGPSDNRNSIKLKTIRLENGRAKSITEVVPLVHDFSNKTYKTTDNEARLPITGNITIGSENGTERGRKTALLS
ncbi:uncharacterized protein LOC127867974 [Dreissena polymorpha]|uniref:uncharacterized protein LOC127867974 n=1 Tax=Dreissena polymorpha TaxID=45954 RepID=UPI0022642979|nr:uncharacterized protein LOC127867974 [Dreissena polymorpha]